MSDFWESGGIIGRETQQDGIVSIICCNTFTENPLLLAMKYCVYYQYEYAACTGLFSSCQCKEKHGDVSVSPTVSSCSPLEFPRLCCSWGPSCPRLCGEASLLFSAFVTTGPLGLSFLIMYFVLFPWSLHSFSQLRMKSFSQFQA